MSKTNYTLTISLSEDNVWDREIIAALSHIPEDYAASLIKAEILKWSKDMQRLSSPNTIALSLEDTALSAVREKIEVEDNYRDTGLEHGGDPRGVPEETSIAHKKKRVDKKNKKRRPLDLSDHNTTQEVDVGTTISPSEKLKNKLRELQDG